MRIPFSSDLDELFTSDRHAVWKILAGGVVGAGLGAKSMFGPDFRMSRTAAVVGTIVVAVVAMVVVAALLLRDVLRQRKEAGKPVNAVLNLYLCKGALSLLLWGITAFVLAILYVATLAQ